MVRISGEVNQFVRVAFKVVKKLKAVLIDVPHILVPLGTDALEGRNPIPDGEMFVKRLGPPVSRRGTDKQWPQAAALIGRRGSDPGPVQEGSRQVDIESGRLGHSSTMLGGQPWINDDQGNPQRFIIVGPLASQSPVAGEVTVIS